MDTVEEECNTCEERKESHGFLQPPEIVLPPSALESQNRLLDAPDGAFHDHSALSSRRQSVIIAALRRPSQAMALSAAHAIMNQRRYLLSMFQDHSERSLSIDDPGGEAEREITLKKYNRKLSDDFLTTILSALYAKLVIVLGMAFPITETISSAVTPFYYQGFYLYLYLGSVTFVLYMYVTLIREKAVSSILNSYQKRGKSSKSSKGEKKLSFLGHADQRPERYGSFYLRLGAIAFGIGSMVYSGLEFGRYFELKNNENCHCTVLQAITPATRMILTLVQVQFIFLNSRDIKLKRHKVVARFGLMHMIATNLCEWLYVLVQETRHEILHLNADKNHSSHHVDNSTLCQEGRVMSSLVANASTFLFPCTIEYSLICAVILYEMWKKMQKSTEENENAKTCSTSSTHDKHHSFKDIFRHPPSQSQNHISLDCSKSHRGLFAGILVIVLTIISLIMFFVLNNHTGSTEEEKKNLRSQADFEVNIVELILYIISTIAIVIAMCKINDLKYHRKFGKGSGIGLDNSLLVVAQTGMFIYCMFSIIGCYFTLESNSLLGLMTEVLSLMQTALQTIFILDACWRRCRNLQQTRRKPGREFITFLIITNMAMWTISTMEKNRAEFRPAHLKFFGDWAWTIITHISMPLAIFYRFHSTICLFEIWKSAYKIKGPYAKHPLLPYLQTS